MLGLVPAPAWMCCDALLEMFGTDRRSATCAYEDFVRAGVGLPSIWEGLRGGIYLGSQKFAEAMQQRVSMGAARALEIPLMQRRPVANSLSAYAAASPRAQAMALAYQSGDYTTREIASHFNVHYATVSRAVAKHRADRGTDSMLDCKT